MKTRLFFVSSFLILAIMGLLFSNFKLSSSVENTSNISSKQQTPPPTGSSRWLEKYFIGAVDCEVDYQVNSNYNNLHTLGFNLWQNYLASESSNGKNTPYVYWLNSIPSINDHLTTPVSEYAGPLQQKITSIYQQNDGRKLIMSRPKIEWLCYGQRSDYKCADVSLLDQNLWFYSFQSPDHIGVDVSDYDASGPKYVRYCEKTIPATSGWVVSRLRANTEQSHRILSGGGEWLGDSQCDWIIKPRIKIPLDFPESHLETPICSIKVIGQDGNTVLKEIVIKGKYFLDDNFQYNGGYGGYIEEYNYHNDPVNLTIQHSDWGDKWGYAARGNHNPDWSSDNHADIQVYWYGNCDMWLDYVRVDNDVADGLLNPNSPNYNNYNKWIEDEIHYIAKNPINGEYPILKYYIELVEFNNLPCMAYVNEKLKYYSTQFGDPNVIVDLMQDLTNTISCHVPWENRTTIENADFLYNYYIQKVGLSQVFVESYPLTGCYIEPKNNFAKIPNTLPILASPPGGRDSVLAKSVPPNEYDSWLQRNLNYKPYCLEGGTVSTPCVPEGTCQLYQDEGNFRYKMQIGNSLSKVANIPFIFMPQLHQNYRPGEIRREPTNEELTMMVNVATSYGAKGMLYFSYISWHTTDESQYVIGATNPGNADLRKWNVYHQENPYKNDVLSDISNRLSNKWGPYLLSFDNTKTNSYIYDFSDERDALQQNSYFLEAATAKPTNGAYPCLLDDPQPTPSPGLLYDCPNDRYLQIATFQNPNETYPHYFMVVNRRCAPVNSDPNKTGLRYVRLRTKANSFPSPNSWSAVDVETGNTFEFISNAISYINICNSGDYNTWFKPGEGRLYHIVPTNTIGGSLACDEYISGGTYTLHDTLYTNGHNLTIGYGTTINFTDSACIVVNGGNFICGDVSQPSHERNIIFRGVTGDKWSGISFNNCDTVNINSVQFQNIKGTGVNVNYALKIVNCPTVNINNCTFTNDDPQKSGAIELNYSSIGDVQTNVYIAGNSFNMNTSDKTIVSVIANAGSNIPVIIDNNTFTSTSNSALAIYLAFVNGIELSGNIISGYNKAIEMHYSNIDVIGNSVTTTTGNSGARGMDVQDYSTVNMTKGGTLRTGGLNYFDNVGSGVNNIFVYNSYFDMNEGQNIFNIASNTNSMHIKGYLSGIGGDGQVPQTLNCFKLDNTAIVDPNLPIEDVKWFESDEDADLYFFSYDCSQEAQCNYVVIDMGNNVYDTICIIPGGEGGGLPSVQTITPKKMYDSLNTLIRLRNFPQAKTKCYELLNTYPDSIQSLNAVSKLYYLAVIRDTSQANISDVKTYLNTLILNHPNNLSLVRKCNYFIQKCKVKLKQYQSSLTGFQQIMQQNPYSYEALLASWDYSATHLLDSINTSGGYDDLNSRSSENSLFTIEEFSSDDLLSIDFNTLFERIDNIMYNDDDKDAFTKEQRKTITKSVATALKDSKNKTESHIEKLTQKSEEGNTYAKTELKVIKTLKEVVTIKKPKTIFEHINSVNKDIQKLNTVKNESLKNVVNVMPTTYNLSQNYPNPFNPVTKINYEIPKDGRVKLVIYDILGREIKTLVNELKQAGRYTVEFNGSQFASGVYFYRIQVEGGKSYTAVKKMVLVK